MLTLGDVTPDSPGFDQLRAECSAAGHHMLERFERGWRDGSNRFDQPGERVVGAFLDGQLVGLCGRNRDLFDPTPRAGRVRHLYVAAAHRRAGIGPRLIASVVEGAGAWFDHLNTNSPPEAAAFYERLGFSPVAAPRITHRLPLLGR